MHFDLSLVAYGLFRKFLIIFMLFYKFFEIPILLAYMIIDIN